MKVPSEFQNSKAFAKYDCFLVWGNPVKVQKSASKKIFKPYFWAIGTKNNFETKLFWLVLTHHFVSCPKKKFSNNFQIWPKILFTENFWKIGILKNPLAKKLFRPSILKRFFREFGISKIFITYIFKSAEPFLKTEKKFVWTNTSDFGAENVPQYVKSKVLLLQVASEFRNSELFAS